MSWFRSIDRWMCNEVLPHQHAFQALARRLTGNGEVARDIVQDVYAEVLGGEGWKKARDAKAFILRAVYCRSVDWVRRRSVVPIHSLPTYEGLAYADGGPDAFETLSGREELSVVLEILEELPTRCREVLVMRRIEELPPKEIAHRLGITLTTVERHLARGASILADRLAEKGAFRRGRHLAGEVITSKKAK